MEYHSKFKESFHDHNTNASFDYQSHKFKSLEKKKLNRYDNLEKIREKVFDKVTNEYSQNFHNVTIKKDNVDQSYLNTNESKMPDKLPNLEIFKKQRYIKRNNKLVPFDNNLSKEQLGDQYSDDGAKKSFRIKKSPDYKNKITSELRKKVDKILAEDDPHKMNHKDYVNYHESQRNSYDNNNFSNKDFFHEMLTPRRKKEDFHRGVSRPRISAERIVAVRQKVINKSFDLNTNESYNKHDQVSNSLNIDRSLNDYARQSENQKKIVIRGYQNAVKHDNQYISPIREYRLMQKDLSSNKRYVNYDETTNSLARDLSGYYSYKKNSEGKCLDKTDEYINNNTGSVTTSKDKKSAKNTSRFDTGLFINHNMRPMINKEKNVREKSNNSMKNSYNFNLNFYFDNSGVNNNPSANNSNENSSIGKQKNEHNQKYLKTSEKNSRNSQKSSPRSDIKQKVVISQKHKRNVDKNSISNIFSNLNIKPARPESNYKIKKIEKPKSKKKSSRENPYRAYESKELSIINSETYENFDSNYLSGLLDIDKKNKILKITSYAILFWHYKDICKKNDKKYLSKSLFEKTAFRQVDAMILWHCKDLLKASCHIDCHCNLCKKKIDDNSKTSFHTIFKNYEEAKSVDVELDNLTIKKTNLPNQRKINNVYASPYLKKITASNRTNIQK